MVEQTTRETNRKVVETLEKAAHITFGMRIDWHAASLLLEEVEQATSAHDAMVDQFLAAMRQYAQAHSGVMAALRAERDGGGR